MILILLTAMLFQDSTEAVVSVVAEPVKVSIFSDAVALDIIQMVTTLLIAVISTWGVIQVARIKSQVDGVHKDINSRMTEMLKDKQVIGEAAGKAKEVQDQKFRDEGTSKNT